MSSTLHFAVLMEEERVPRSHLVLGAQHDMCRLDNSVEAVLQIVSLLVLLSASQTDVDVKA